MPMPCILHWNFDHFVVLTSVTSSKVVIVDPGFGERQLSHEEVSKQFTGVAMELSPDARFEAQKAEPAISLRELTGPIRGLWRSLGLILSLSFALQVFIVIAPFFMQWVVDQVLVSADRSMLTILVVGFVFCLFLQVGIGVLRGWSVIYLSSTVGVQWMSNVFAHLMRLPLDFFEKRHLGDVTSRAASVQAIQKTLTTSFVEALIDGAMAVVTLSLMLIYSAKLALVTLFSVAVYAAIRAASYDPIRTCTEQQLIASSKQQSHLLESLRGIRSLKVSGEETQRRSVYDGMMIETVNHEVRLAGMNLGFTSASQIVFGLERIIVIWIGALLALQSTFSVGMLISYLAYKDQFAERISALIDKCIEFRMLRLHGERLADIVLAEPERDVDFESLPPSDAGIEVEDLFFRYSEDEPWVLSGCSFTVRSGESVAIVGPSGCGKSTLIKVLLGLLKPTAGTVRIGGRDLHKDGARSIRSIVGTVMQDDQLFAGNISDNISFFTEDVDQQRIEAAAKLASVHDEIVAMPMGYHSLIGDMGSSLSGGQKQRIILARALYRDPKLLFLDEATSHLDVGKERLVNDAVKELKLTKLIVAHRPETIASADRVLAIDEGHVVDAIEPRENPRPGTNAPDVGKVCA